MRVLWFENHTVFARMAGRQFLSAHELTVVPSISAAKNATVGGSFDAVLIDYDLDDGKGDELVRFVRQLQARIPVIATSSHDDGNAALLAAGADAACPKARFVEIEAVLRSLASN